MPVSNLKELLKHPGWVEYEDLVEEYSINLFGELIQLDPSQTQSFIKFVELKAKIDGMKEITYFIERQLAKPEEISNVDVSYGQRLKAMFKKIWRKK